MSYAYVFTLHRTAQGGPRRSDTLESHLKRIVDPEEREKVEAELTKIDIALSFLEKEMPSQSTVSK